jgi:hypothetical protein
MDAVFFDGGDRLHEAAPETARINVEGDIHHPHLNVGSGERF